MSINKKFIVFGLFLLTQGCGDWNFLTVGLDGIEERYVVGSHDETKASLYVGETKASSSDPSVVEIVELDENRFDLRAVGIGHAKVEIEDDEGRQVYDVEVTGLDPELTRLDLVETDIAAVVPVIPVAGQNIVAGVDQHFAVRYADENGALYGSGLATVDLPEGASECPKARSTSLDLFCANFEAAGEYTLSVAVGDDTHLVSITAVLESDVVGLQLLASNEETLSKGDRGRIDAVGLTDSGTYVFGIGASFDTADREGITGYFVYDYSPKAEPIEVTATAMGFEQVTSFRGERAYNENVHDCSAAPWTVGAVSPLAAMALMLMGAVRVRRERFAAQAL